MRKRSHRWCKVCAKLSFDQLYPRLEKRQKAIDEIKAGEYKRLKKTAEYKRLKETDDEIAILKKRMSKLQKKMQGIEDMLRKLGTFPLRKLDTMNQIDYLKQQKKPRKYRNQQSKKTKALDLFAQGFSPKEIADQIGANVDYIRGVLREERKRDSWLGKLRKGKGVERYHHYEEPTEEPTIPERPSKKEDSGYTVGKDLVKSLAEMFFKNLADRMVITQKENKDDD